MDSEATKQEVGKKASDNARQPLQPSEPSKITYGTSPAFSAQPDPRDLGANGDKLLTPGKSHPFLDITRICCVWCVAVDHGNWSFGHWNCMFAQDWVLQYLFLVCGVSYGLSSRRLAGYISRLFAYFALGVLLNWLAAVVTGSHWRTNMFDVVFHLWFVVGLMIYAVLLAPLKWYLQRTLQSAEEEEEEERRRAAVERDPETSHPQTEEDGQRQAAEEERDSSLWAIIVICGGVVCITVFFTVVTRPIVKLLAAGAGSSLSAFGGGADFWGLPQDVQEARIFFHRLSTYLMCSSTSVYLMVACPRFLRQPSATTWLVVLNTYIHKLFFYRGQDDRFFHGLDIMIMGMSCYFLGLRHRRLIGMYIVRYWFVVLLVCALIWPPGVHQRFDEVPPVPEDFDLRIRVYLLEAIFVVIWLAAGERLVQPEIFTEDKLTFLNNWGLLIFLVHKAVHVAIFSPLNWAVLLLLAPACCWAQHWWK